MARPKIQIDKSQFEKLCGLQCTQEEIASFFECSHDTIERWCKEEYKEKFCVVYNKKSSTGKITLRRYQLNLAKTNSAMAIWLGKNMLGQKDSIDVGISSNEDDDLTKAIKGAFKNDK